MSTTMQINDVELRNFVRFSDLAEEPLITLPPISGYEQAPLVTLEEAIEPLISIVPNIKQMIDIINEKCEKEIQDGLTRNESASVMLYTMQWQPKEQSMNIYLNRILRDDNREKLKPWFLYLKLFMKSLLKLPSIHCYVYRGVPNDLSQDYSQGKIFHWWGFAVCTQSIEIMENEQNFNQIDQRTRFKIECKSAKNIQNHSFYQINNEVLLLAAQCYKVISNIDSGDGLHIIQLKEIDPYVTSPLITNDRTSSMSLSFSQRRSSFNLSTQNTSFYSVVLKLTGSKSSTYHNSHLEELLRLSKSNSSIDLSVRELTDQDMSIVVQRGIIDKKCKSLYLTGNKISNQSLPILSDALYNNLTLVELDLSDNYISDLGVKILMDVLLTNKSILKKLHLGSNNISDQGIEYLSTMLKTNHTLTHLMLNRNHISNYGVNLLSNVLALHNISLEVLSLSSNNLITDLCVESLIMMLKQNQTLKELDIKCCNISSINKQRLREIIHEKHNFKLFTTNNQNHRCLLS